MYVCMYLGVVSVIWSGPQIPILLVFQATATCLRSLFVRVRWSLDMEESKSDRASARKRKLRATASEDMKAKKREDDRLRETKSTGRRERCQVRQTFSLDHGEGQGRFAFITHATATSYIAPRHTSYTWLQQKSTCISPDILPHEAYSAHAYS